MHSPNLASTATPSPSRVRFNADVSPSTERHRRASLPYPKVAQTKGSADRRFSFDLCWKLHTLSAASSIVPVDSTESEPASEVLSNKKPKDCPAESTMPRKPRPHNYIVLSRKQTKALLESDDPEDRRLQELVRAGKEGSRST